MSTFAGVGVAGVEKEKVKDTVKDYLDFHNDKSEDRTSKRKMDYATMVNQYYNLATDFYEWGWGLSFHFAVRHKKESFDAAIARHEFQMAHSMGLKKGDLVLDIGCGVGGPARNIARFIQCNVIGLNNNQYQIDRATRHTKAQGLEGRVNFVKGDFMHIPFEDNHFDGVYEIEATAHAPDKVACFREVFRVLKPGAFFGGYEWCLTDKYNPEDPKHRALKKGIEEGDGLPDIATTREVEEALKEAGFEFVHCRDVAEDAREGYEYPWYFDLTPSYIHPKRFQHTPTGKWLMAKALVGLEKLHLVPKGTTGVSAFLNVAAQSLVEGGQLGIFTPMFFHLARKPSK